MPPPPPPPRPAFPNASKSQGTGRVKGPGPGRTRLRRGDSRGLVRGPPTSRAGCASCQRLTFGCPHPEGPGTGTGTRAVCTVGGREQTPAPLWEEQGSEVGRPRLSLEEGLGGLSGVALLGRGCSAAPFGPWGLGPGPCLHLQALLASSFSRRPQPPRAAVTCPRARADTVRKLMKREVPWPRPLPRLWT